MGELVYLFPERDESKSNRKPWARIRKVYAIVVLDPFLHLLDIQEFLETLVNSSEDGETVNEDFFYDLCGKENLGADTAFEIYEALSLNGIFIFGE